MAARQAAATAQQVLAAADHAEAEAKAARQETVRLVAEREAATKRNLPLQEARAAAERVAAQHGAAAVEATQAAQQAKALANAEETEVLAVRKAAEYAVSSELKPQASRGARRSATDAFGARVGTGTRRRP